MQYSLLDVHGTVECRIYGFVQRQMPVRRGAGVRVHAIGFEQDNVVKVIFMSANYAKGISGEKVIGIGKHQPLANGMPQSDVPGMTGSAAFLVEYARGMSAPLPGKMLKVNFLLRTVVIDHNHLHIRCVWD